jgi:hypothetical protein
MYEMQVLNGRKAHFSLGANGMVEDDPGEWRSLRPVKPVLAPPFRYCTKEEAEMMLERLFPDLPPTHKRVVAV